MNINISKVTQILESSSQEMINLAKGAAVNPQKAMEIVPQILQSYQQLKDSTIDEIRASAKNSEQLESLQSAIQKFLTISKEAQEKAGALQATLFANPAFTNLTDKLQKLRDDFLKRGVKVEKSELDELR